MKKFLLLAAFPFLFATYSNAATPKAEALKPASAHKQTKQRFSGKITGYQAAEHSFSVRKGDRLRISKTGSQNAYFNVWAPKGDEAVFDGSTQGDKFDSIATQSGKYKVQVLYDARPSPPQHYCPLHRKRHQKLNALMM